jgi:hypothetical protein
VSYLATVSKGVQLLVSAPFMNLRFIGVSNVMLQQDGNDIIVRIEGWRSEVCNHDVATINSRQDSHGAATLRQARALGSQALDKLVNSSFGHTVTDHA